MAIKFRPMTEKDYKSLGSSINTVSKRNAYDAMSGCLDSMHDFGKEAPRGNLYKSMARANVRAYIPLAAPTFNYVLSRSKAGLLWRVLGVRAGLGESINDFTVIMDKATGELINLSDADADGEYLYGPEIAIRYIDELDIPSAIVDALYDSLVNAFRKRVDKEDVILRRYFDIVKETREENPLEPGEGALSSNPGVLSLPGGYSMVYSPGSLYKIMKKDSTIKDLKSYIQTSIFESEDSRLSYLLNLRSKDNLYGMINKHIAVVPPELRPTVNDRQHPLTGRYATIISANQDLSVTLRETSVTPAYIADKYKALNTAVSLLQYKCRELNSKLYKLDDMSLVERVKGKHGIIRQNCLGKRQDYSGRAVVIVNPYLPLDVIRVPKRMLPSLLEFHILPYLAENIERYKDESAKSVAHTREVYSKLRLTNLDSPKAQEEMLKIIEDERLLEKIPMFLGRQPTLHKHGMQGFHIEETDAIGIEVNPLVCPAFNMDFDGDTAHIEVPITPGAIKDVEEKLLTTKNIYLHKTGDCTIMPRQDMLYGLYTLTRSTYTVGSPIKSYESLEGVRQDVINHRLYPWDTVTCGEYTALAGDLAVISCFPKGYIVPRNYEPSPHQLKLGEITNKTIAQYVSKLIELDDYGNMILPLGTRRDTTQTFTGAINHIVELGFRVARIYSPSISLVGIDLKSGDEIEKFHKSMDKLNLYFSYGLETSNNYKIAFDANLEVLQKTVEGNIYDKLGSTNGYCLLAKSGARGGTSNLTQMFAYKGRVKKNSSESFDALLENSYTSQLSPMESFIAAYGGRQGLIDKTLNTGNTGYASRKMWHATSGIYITTHDCGTTEGIKISKEFLSNFSTEDSPEGRRKEIESTFAHAITGRFLVGEDKIVTKQRAQQLATDDSVQSVRLRSPITCKNKCCQKCYGLDLGTHKLVGIGFPAGEIAAQSVGETATQLTMKEFQKGGVATKGTLTSAFFRVNDYFNVSNMKSKPGYDPVAWADGKVITGTVNDPSKKMLRIEGSPEKVVVPADFKVKDYVTKGTGFSYIHGDYDITEVTDIMGISYAQLYLAFKLYSLYKSECNIAMIHFELMVECMTRHMVINTDRSDLRIGQYHTSREILSGDLSNTTYVSRLKSLKSLSTMSNEALNCINMENHVKGISRACLLGLSDTLTQPMNKVIVGKYL